MENKRKKKVKGKVENWKQMENKSENEQRTLFSLLFFFSLFETTEICFRSTKMEIFYREKAFPLAGKNQDKWLCPLWKIFLLRHCFDVYIYSVSTNEIRLFKAIPTWHTQQFFLFSLAKNRFDLRGRKLNKCAYCKILTHACCTDELIRWQFLGYFLSIYSFRNWPKDFQFNVLFGEQHLHIVSWFILSYW